MARMNPVRSLVFFALTALVACTGSQARDDIALQQSDFHYQLAIGHYHASETPIAIRELMTSLELHPDNVDALYLLAFIYQGRRDYAESERLYEQALAIQPGRNDIKNGLGTVYLQTERWYDAEELFRALTRVPTYSTPGHAYNNLGWALFNQGRVSESLEQFELAIEFQPELCLAYNNRGMAEETLGSVRSALESFGAAIRECPNYAEPLYRRGVLRWQLERYDDALEDFDACYEEAPQSDVGRRCLEYLRANGMVEDL